MKLTKEKLQQIIKEELESLVSEEAFPEDKYDELQKLKNRVGLANRIMDDIGDEGYEALLKLKKENDKKMKTIPKDAMTTDPPLFPDPQSKRYVVRSKLINQGKKLFKGKEDSSITLEMVNDFFDRDQPDLKQLKAMIKQRDALSGEFEVKPADPDGQDRYYGRTSMTVTHGPSGTSKKVYDKQGSLGGT